MSNLVAGPSVAHWRAAEILRAVIAIRDAPHTSAARYDEYSPLVLRENRWFHIECLARFYAAECMFMKVRHVDDHPLVESG